MLIAEKPRDDIADLPLSGWKTRSHKRDEITEGADVLMRGYPCTSWVFAPTHLCTQFFRRFCTVRL